METAVDSKVFSKWHKVGVSCEKSCVGWFCLSGFEMHVCTEPFLECLRSRS